MSSHGMTAYSHLYKQNYKEADMDSLIYSRVTKALTFLTLTMTWKFNGLFLFII